MLCNGREFKDWAGTAIRTVGSNPTLSAMPY